MPVTTAPVCVTGATGYIAGAIVQDLLGHGYSVRGTTRDPDRAWREGYVRAALAHREGYPREAALFSYTRYVGDLARASLLGLAVVLIGWLTRAGRLAVSAGTLSRDAVLIRSFR